MKNKEITSREIDFGQWYTNIVTKAELIDYSAVKGSLIMRPYGYAIWEEIQKAFDKRFKETNHENVYMPMFIPESLLNKEKAHVEGFAPEVAWVTHGGSKELEERLCVRPTSETLFCDHYAKIINSYRDLPKLYNQWCSVVRWEKTTRPFLRSREFLWQEGHTVHATSQEAKEETFRMLDIYAEVIEKYLAIPVLKGRKTEKEKFAGAEDTYTIEALMHNGVALQSGTSHYFGQNFSKPFDIKFTNKDNELEYAYQTSWGVSTRLIGGIIMVHGDDNGLILPPNIAPVKAIIIPIGKEEDVFVKADEIKQDLIKNNLKTVVDLTEKSPGFKFADAEMKGIPVRIEIGPRDLANNECVIVRRDTNEKTKVSLDKVTDTVNNLLAEIQINMFNKAKENMLNKTYEVKTLDEIKDIMQNTPGFVRTGWCGDLACEEKVKEETGASSRCIPFDENYENKKCAVCGKEAKHELYFGLQY